MGDKMQQSEFVDIATEIWVQCQGPAGGSHSFRSMKG